ncbi:hypothetical protein IEQ34_000711 [Dendrobium chrysotoxum]|uniref:Leucine-rich repeat-containing N-terminal plant-type domain-containing protein n=1 Tax=Dendrobium chrysotoxum TaxID=161865 RepID=A0AAV7HTY3_DENCH|nr:hypothetical protein IEQ34_000711 [Dendrobium chrysotoxum]
MMINKADTINDVTLKFLDYEFAHHYEQGTTNEIPIAIGQLTSLLMLNIFFWINCHALGICLQKESSVLLQLKQGFTSNELDTWQPGTNCCIWEGVTCDKLGQVICLNLRNRFISGTIDPSLFNLTSLCTLNFADNQFNRISIPKSGWDQLANLSSLDLSHAGFVGEIPVGIFHLTKLTSLDLSSFNHKFKKLYLTIQPTFLRNMSSLRELYLDHTYGNQWCGALVNSTLVLEALSMTGCSLFGASCSSLFMLPFLSILRLGYNNLDSSILDSFVNFTSLYDLRVQGKKFKGIFPKKSFN